jgi:hypothetical protein
MTGVPASPSGLRPFGAEPQASQAEPLVPNAVEALQLVPKTILDQWSYLDLGEPQQAWACAVDRFKEEAQINQQCAEQQRKIAADASEQARLHAERAVEFDSLARAIERAAITFPASVDTLPKGQDAQQGLAGTESGAVGDSRDAQTPSPNLSQGDTP